MGSGRGLKPDLLGHEGRLPRSGFEKPDEYIPILAYDSSWPPNRASHEAKGFMDWDQIVASCKHLKDKSVFQCAWMSSDNGTRR